MTVVQLPSGAAQPACTGRVESTASPLRVMVATTFGWASAWRLAIELANVGCDVEAVAPANSALHHLAAVATTYRLGRVRPVETFVRAIGESRADLIIPFDDRTRQVLHLIHDRADPSTRSGADLREKIVRSLGPAATFAGIYSRAYLMTLAGECGVKCPATAAVASLDEVISFVAEHETVVLKTDGSWGGREVALARSPDEAARAWRRLSRPPGLGRVGKRWFIDRDPWPLRTRLRRQQPFVSVQAYVSGRPANVAAACVDGELVAAVQVEVVRSNGVFGPSTVIRVIDHPDMLFAAKALIGKLQLTGLCGLDFVLDPRTGRAEFIELNPRATPTAHLLAADGTDVLATLRLALGRAGPAPRTCTYPDGLVALFPLEMQRDPTSLFLTTAFHDVPEEYGHLSTRNGGHRSKLASLTVLG